MRKFLKIGVVLCGAALAMPAMADSKPRVLKAVDIHKAIESGSKLRIQVEFEGESQVLTERGRAQVAELATLLRSDPTLKVGLGLRAGELAKSRAAAIRRELVKMGVADARVEANQQTTTTVAVAEYLVYRH